MTLYSQVYGMEVVLPTEVEVESLGIILESQIPKAEWVISRYEQFKMKRDYIQGYQRGMVHAFNKKVKPTT